MSSDKSTNKLLRLAYKEEDKKSGYSRVINFIIAGDGVIVNTTSTLKDLTGRYSISESSVFVPDVIIEEELEANVEDNGKVDQTFLVLKSRN